MTYKNCGIAISILSSVFLICFSSGAVSEENPAQTLYDQAFQSLRLAQYNEAETSLREFLTIYPKHPLAENAKYWLGETCYVEGKLQEAAVIFAEGYQKFPKGNKAPDNLLKLATSLGYLDKKEDACSVLSALHQRFPNPAALIKKHAEEAASNFGCAGAYAEQRTSSETDASAQRKVICQLRFSAALGSPGGGGFSGSLSRAETALADCMEGRASAPQQQLIIEQQPSNPTRCTTNWHGGTAHTTCY